MITSLKELIKIANDIHLNSGGKKSIDNGEDAMFSLEWYQEVDDMIDHAYDDNPYTISRFYNWTYEVNGTPYETELIKHDTIEDAESYINTYEDYKCYAIDS